MPTVALISKPNKPELKDVLSGVIEWLQHHGYEPLLDPYSRSYIPDHRQAPREQLHTYKPEFAVVLGGDGTLLAAARAMVHAGIPLLAVNLGSLGFLTEVSLSELYVHLRSVVERSYVIDERSMLQCRLVRSGEVLHELEALNDVVLKTIAARLADFEVSINGYHVAHYKADALIIATSTGSTAYSLAAGGPILVPTVKAFVITPVSPHALTHRPLVVEESSKIVINVAAGEREAFLATDGQVSLQIETGDRVECALAKCRVKLIRAKDGHKFFEVLRAKLHWGER